MKTHEGKEKCVCVRACLTCSLSQFSTFLVLSLKPYQRQKKASNNLIYRYPLLRYFYDIKMGIHRGKFILKIHKIVSFESVLDQTLYIYLLRTHTHTHICKYILDGSADVLSSTTKNLDTFVSLYTCLFSAFSASLFSADNIRFLFGIPCNYK